MKRSTVVTGVLVVVALGLAAGGVYYVQKYLKKEPSQQAAPVAYEPSEAVELVEAREIPWQPTADLVGTVIANRSVAVRNELAGVITTVGFNSGSVVEKGDVLLTMDTSTEKADLDAANAAVRVAEAMIPQVDSRIHLAEIELKRMKSAMQGGAAVDFEIDRAQTEVDTVKADRVRWLAEIDQAKARAAQLQARLEKMTISAPFRARTGMRNVHEGQYLAEGGDVVALQELTDQIYLDFAIPQEYAPRVKPGTVVMATGELLGPEPVRIEVVAVDATVSYDTRNLRIRAVVDNTKGTLVPGMFVQVRVPIDAPKTFVAVPSTAIRRAAYATMVFVVSPDENGVERAHQRVVSLGQTVGEDVIVLEGLKAGEKIAAAGSFKLRDGVKVMVGPPGGAPGGAPGAGGPGGGDGEGKSGAAPKGDAGEKSGGAAKGEKSGGK
jgi:membrane fusion protein (multidrug efflux system)